jgi:hypothetical protein
LKGKSSGKWVIVLFLGFNTFDFVQIKSKTMKKNIFYPLALAFFSITTVHAQNGVVFEYDISSSTGATGNVKGYFSDAGFRSETTMNIPQMPNGGFSHTSLHLKEKPDVMITLDDKAKTYSEREIKDRPQDGNTDSITVKIIGQEKMGRYACTHSQVKDHGRVSEFWTTRDIPEYEKYQAAHKGSRYMGKGNTEAALKKAGADGFLVKTFSKDGRMGETSVELAKFEKKDIPASLFTVPADYTKTVPPAYGNPGQGFDPNKIKDMSPEERQKFIDAMKKQNGGGH